MIMKHVALSRAIVSRVDKKNEVNRRGSKEAFLHAFSVEGLIRCLEMLGNNLGFLIENQVENNPGALLEDYFEPNNVSLIL